MNAILPFVLFALGVVAVVWATERLLEGMVGLARLLRVSTFAIAAILSGFEVENVAVGLAAARREATEVALGTVFGGAIFLVCVALSLGAVLYPLQVRLPRGFLALIAACPVVIGIALVGESTGRLAGAFLLLAFAGAVFYMVRASRDHEFLESEEVRESEEKRHSYPKAAGLTILGFVVIAAGGELVTLGAEGVISTLGLSALLVGMVITPAAIEVEEVIRQAVPAREGRPEVSAGNLMGTLLYFLWFNLAHYCCFSPSSWPPSSRSTLTWTEWASATMVAARRSPNLRPQLPLVSRHPVARSPYWRLPPQRSHFSRSVGSVQWPIIRGSSVSTSGPILHP